MAGFIQLEYVKHIKRLAGVTVWEWTKVKNG